MTAETGSIIIDPSISLDMDNASCEAAEQTARKFEIDAVTSPHDTLTAIAIAHDSLADPAQADLVDMLRMSSRQREIASNIAQLLHHTQDGSYLDVDDKTYTVLSSDSTHQQLVSDSQNANRRRDINPVVARRRVGLSTLRLFAQQWGKSADKNQSEVA
jgi:hypothetical protein